MMIPRICSVFSSFSLSLFLKLFVLHHMYSKCGDTLLVEYLMTYEQKISIGMLSIIQGLALHALGEEALAQFHLMLKIDR
jgi:hypothetical protein